MVQRIWALRTALTVILALVAGPAPALVTDTAQAAPTARAATPPLSGFFVSAGSTDAENTTTLRQIKQVGGDTVVTFGNTLRTSSLDGQDRIRTGGEIDPAFTACRIDGRPCATAMAAEGRIRRVLTFANHSHFTQGALQCPLDRAITSRGQRFTLLMIPTGGEGCTSADGRYDLVAIHGGAAKGIDRTVSLLAAADRAGMAVYVGMPSVEKRTDVPWLPDLSYQDTFAEFTDRFLRYHKAVGATAALAGFYHHTEMPVAAGDVWQPVLDLYRLQNRAIARILPGRAALVSPYLDNRRSANPGTDREELSAKTRDGARAIAETASGVPLTIALQDGMGTGKGGSYLVNERNGPVDPHTAAFVGEGTWDNTYVMPVSDSFRAASAGLEGTGARLWANVEGMTPQGGAGDTGCGAGGPRGKTTKDRLDRQVQAVARYTAKNISFRWDPYYTCQVSGTTLAEALRHHVSTPLITNAALNPQKNALWVAGYNLAGSTATVKYTDTHGRVRTATAQISAFSPGYGRHARLDRGLEGATYPVTFTEPQRGKIFIVSVTSRTGGPGSRSFSLRY
ncbi:hypothetical protein [Ornithinimicrobium cavernae]|uniref:hypothetical protein n=1 Tax=Ornithinimicrobium cavernae TaxID=2666047 RepID=UPI000D698E4B|nr:hypothetical protein [Ornithinimicrobium cavernae]